MFHGYVSLQEGKRHDDGDWHNSTTTYCLRNLRQIRAGKEAATGCRIPWFLGDGNKAMAWGENS